MNRRFWIILGLALILGGGLFVLKHKADKLFRLWLQEQFDTFANGKYVLTFKKSSINILTGYLNVRDVSFSPVSDSVQNDEITIKGNLPVVQINVARWWSIYFTRKLEIRQINVSDPRLKIIRQRPGSKPLSLSLESGQLYQDMSDYLVSFGIQNLAASGGTVEYENKAMEPPLKIKLPDIALVIRGLRIDSLSLAQHNKAFYSEDVRLSVRKFSYLLPDSTHELSFNSLALSTKEKDIRIGGLSLTRTAHPLLSGKMAFNLHIPGFHLQGIDFLRAYKTGELHIKTLRIGNPDITADQDTINGNTNQVSAADLRELFGSLFRGYYVDSLNMYNGSINLTLPRRQMRHIGHLNLKIAKYRLIKDPSEADTLLRSFFSAVDVNLDDYSLVSADSLFKLTVGAASLSTTKKILELDSANLSTLENRQFKTIVTGKKLLMQGLNVNKALLEGNVMAEKADLNGIRMIGPLSIAGKKKLVLRILPNSRSSLLKLLNSVKINEINMNHGFVDGTLLTKSGVWQIGVPDLNVSTDSFALKAMKTDSLVNSFGKWLVSASGVQLRDPNGAQYSVGNAVINAESNNAIFASFHYHAPGGRDIKWNSLRVEGFDPELLESQGILKCRNLSSDSPEIVWGEMEPSSIKSNAKSTFPLIARRVHLTNGEFNYTNKGKAYFLHNFSISAQNVSGEHSSHTWFPIRCDSLKLNAQEVLLPIAHNQYKVSGENFQLVYPWLQARLQHVLVSPILPDSSKSYGLARIKSVYLNAIQGNIESPFNKWESISAIEPDITIISRPKLSKVQTSRAASSYTISNISIRDGRLRYYSAKDTLKLALINATGKGLSLSADEKYGIKKVQDLNGDLDRIYYRTSSGKSDIKKLKLNYANGELTMERFTYQPILKKGNLQKISLDNVSVHGIVLPKALHQGIWQADSARIGSMRLYAPFTIATDNGSQHLAVSKNLKRLEIGKMAIQDIWWTQPSAHNSNDTPPITGDVVLQHFTLTPKANALIPAVQSVKCHLHDFQWPLEHGLMLCEAKNIALEAPSGDVSINNLHIHPIHSLASTGKFRGYESDVADISIDSISARINCQKIWRKQLFARFIYGYGINAILYRDKTLPDPEQQKNLPASALRSSKWLFSIDTISLKNGSVTYYEKISDALQPGQISLSHVSLSASNLISPQLKLAKKNLNAQFSAMIMGQGLLHATYSAPLTSTDDQFQFQLNIDGMPLTLFNPILEPIAGVRVKHGDANSLKLIAKGNNSYATGKMGFFYHNLQVQILRTKKHPTKGLGQALGTFFANTIIKSTHKETPFQRYKDVYFERNQNRGLVNDLVKIALAGIRANLGVNNFKGEVKKAENKVIGNKQATDPASGK